MSPIEEQVLDQFIEALNPIDGVNAALADALRSELTAPKGPNAARLADLIREASEGTVG